MYHKFNSANGLLSSDNYGVVQDKENYIWVFSESGVLKYDGYQFKSFKSINGMISNDIWDIRIDSKNRKWLSFFGQGIQYINDDIISTVRGTDSEKQYFYVGEHSDTVFFSALTIGTNIIERHYWLPGQSLKPYNRFKSKGYEVLGDFRELGWMLLVRENKQFLLNISTSNIEVLSFQLKSIVGTYINDSDRLFRENNTDEIWLITEKGFQKRNEPKMIGANFQNILQERGQNIVVLKKENFEVYTNYEKGVRNDRIEELLNSVFDSPLLLGSVFIDKEENLWVTQWRGEIFFFPNTWKLTTSILVGQQPEIDKNLILPIVLDEKIVFRTKTSKLYSFNPKDNSLFEHNDTFAGLTIRRVRQANNKLYVHASYNFMVVSLNKKGDANSISKTYNIRSSFDFDFLSPDSILFGNGDLLVLSNSKITENYMDLPIRASNLIKFKSWLVYSLNGGLEALNIETKIKKRFSISNVSFIKEINETIVVGTKGGGCHFFSAEVEKISSFLNGYEVNDVVKIGEDWLIATNKGLILANIKNDQLKIKNVLFGQKKISKQINAVCPINGKIYLFTSKGINVIDPKLLYNKSQKLNFSINKISVNGISLDRADVKFETGSNYLNIELKSISFWNLEEAYFRYKLHGLDHKWHVTQNKNLQFNNLGPGKYRLEVSISNFPLGNFGSTKFIEFEVSPTLLSTWWVKMLFILGILILMAIASMIVRRVVLLRERRARNLKSLKLKAITAQLNPHFVFNSLNTIQSLVILKSEYEANKYIGAFAGLMRKVLDSSMKERINLKDEIQFLDNYLELENQRLNKKLDYSINCSPEINTHSIFVYSMVFQPIVENAIVHGLINKKGDKRITINFKLEENILVCTISDNGIGLKASAEINKNKVNKSWSSTILKEKMQLLNYRNKKELEIQINDLQDNEGCIGTEVIVRMRTYRDSD